MLKGIVKTLEKSDSTNVLFYKIPIAMISTNLKYIFYLELLVFKTLKTAHAMNGVPIIYKIILYFNELYSGQCFSFTLVTLPFKY